MTAVDVINTALLLLLNGLVIVVMPWVVKVERRLATLCNGGENSLVQRVGRVEERTANMELHCTAQHGELPR